MTLATRCPRCHTAFRVVPDQLRVSEGWVRCGQCSEVFDASASLLEIDVSSTPDVGTSAQPSDSAPSGIRTGESAAEQPSTDLSLPLAETASTGDQSTISTPPTEPVPVPSAVERVTEQTSHSAERAAQNAGGSVDEAIEVSLATWSSTSDTASVPTFVAKADRRTRPRSRVAQVLLGILAMISLTGLGGQWALHERDALAAKWPTVRPWLLEACRPLACTVGPPRADLDDLVVESSSFSRVRGNAYRLSVVLRNRASTSVALPSLEVTLTDSDDQVIARKVLSASQWAPKVNALAAKDDFTGAIAFSTNIDKVTGYRVLAFYP